MTKKQISSSINFARPVSSSDWNKLLDAAVRFMTNPTQSRFDDMSRCLIWNMSRIPDYDDTIASACANAVDAFTDAYHNRQMPLLVREINERLPIDLPLKDAGLFTQAWYVMMRADPSSYWDDANPDALSFTRNMAYYSMVLIIALMAKYPDIMSSLISYFSASDAPDPKSSPSTLHQLLDQRDPLAVRILYRWLEEEITECISAARGASVSFYDWEYWEFCRPKRDRRQFCLSIPAVWSDDRLADEWADVIGTIALIAYQEHITSLVNAADDSFLLYVAETDALPALVASHTYAEIIQWEQTAVKAAVDHWKHKQLMRDRWRSDNDDAVMYFLSQVQFRGVVGHPGQNPVIDSSCSTNQPSVAEEGGDL